jgi:hypothetical protein
VFSEVVRSVSLLRIAVRTSGGRDCSIRRVEGWARAVSSTPSFCKSSRREKQVIHSKRRSGAQQQQEQECSSRRRDGPGH